VQVDEDGHHADPEEPEGRDFDHVETVPTRCARPSGRLVVQIKADGVGRGRLVCGVSVSHWIVIDGAPGRNRTCDPRLRRPLQARDYRTAIEAIVNYSRRLAPSAVRVRVDDCRWLTMPLAKS
jgi:hypothetical protein